MSLQLHPFVAGETMEQAGVDFVQLDPATQGRRNAAQGEG